jgi:tetrahydromethanopterin S-methyltransferase subunit F
MPDIAQEALDSAKSAHHRIDGIEEEVKDIRSLTTAMGRMDEKVDNLKSDVDEIKTDVKEITSRPSKLWDYLVAAAIGALAAGIVAAVLSHILK